MDHNRSYKSIFHMTKPKIMSLNNIWNIIHFNKKVVKPKIFADKAVEQTVITSH